MALTQRQTILYRHTASIYRKLVGVSVDGGSAVSDATYQLVASGVACYKFATPETDEPSPIGRQKTINIFTLDEFHFESGTELDDAYAIQFTTSGHPDNGFFWYVQGNKQEIASSGNRVANYCMVLAKRSVPLEAGQISP